MLTTYNLKTVTIELFFIIINAINILLFIYKYVINFDNIIL